MHIKSDNIGKDINQKRFNKNFDKISWEKKKVKKNKKGGK